MQMLVKSVVFRTSNDNRIILKHRLGYSRERALQCVLYFSFLRLRVSFRSDLLQIPQSRFEKTETKKKDLFGSMIIFLHLQTPIVRLALMALTQQ